MPAIAESSEVLPAPFGPTMATALASIDPEVDALHRGDGAVADDEAAGLDQALAGRACRSGSFMRALPR